MHNCAITTLSATEARRRLYALIDEVGQSHEPVQITGKRGNAVLLSEDDWRAIQETPISSHPPMKPWSGSCTEPAHGASTSSTGSCTRCWKGSRS
jgi:antitoxin YefM